MKKQKLLNKKQKTFLKIETKISPAARKMATESKIDLDDIMGSGKNGVILKEDLMNLMGKQPAPSEKKVKAWARRKN